ncbi:MAG: NUDIX domain-containing protein [bacterium]|nr:NUDIX domain-containing protein [bacterium]
MRILHGERIGATGALCLCTSAVIFDRCGKVLLTRRSDNGRWCLPGGHMEAGEGVEESCAREVREETGLEVRVGRLIGVYGSPDRVVEYAGGDRFQMVVLSFEAEAVGGALATSGETTACGFFSRAEIGGMDVLEHHLERIDDAAARRPEAFVR